jgi:hypothetical protein
MIGDPPRADRVVLRLAGRPRRGLIPVLGPGVDAPQRFGARSPACVRPGEEHLQVGLRAGVRRADRTDDLRRPAVHASRALRRRGSQHQPADDRLPDQRSLLRNEAADGEAEEAHLAELHGGDERDGVARHLLDGVRGSAGGAADSGVVERHDPPRQGQRADQRGIPVVQVPAEMLEKDQRRPALTAAGVAVGIVNAVGGTDRLVGKIRISLSHGWSPLSPRCLDSEPAPDARGRRQGMPWSSPWRSASCQAAPIPWPICLASRLTPDTGHH